MRTATEGHPGKHRAAGAALLRCCRGLGSESGNALVELALILAFFAAPLLLGTAEVGLLVYDSLEVANAAAAGARYAMQSTTYAADLSGITTAAQEEATDFGAALTVTPSVFYVCSSAITGTRYTGSDAESAANSACTSGSNHALQFVELTTSASVSPLIHFVGLPAIFSLKGDSIMEIEQ